MKIKVNTIEDGKRVVKDIEVDDMPQEAVEPTEEELRILHNGECLSEIGRLKGELAESDYKAIKYAEGWISAEEYAEVRAERQKIRDRINELESEINDINSN